MCFVCIFIRIYLYPGLVSGRGDCTETHTMCSFRFLGFTNHISKFPLSFSLSEKLLTLIITFFKSDDIAFLFGLLTACDT